jgi:serine/threonine protein kinase
MSVFEDRICGHDGFIGDVTHLNGNPVDGRELRSFPDLSIRADNTAVAASSCQRYFSSRFQNKSIMVTTDGMINVLDFGLAKLHEPNAVDEEALTAAETTPGEILGTAADMSPEQAMGRPVDARSDIFSLDPVLYEMLSGRRGFGGERAMASRCDVQFERVSFAGDRGSMEKAQEPVCRSARGGVKRAFCLNTAQSGGQQRRRQRKGLVENEIPERTSTNWSGTGRPAIPPTRSKKMAG